MLVTNHMEVSKKPEQNYTTALSKEEPGTKVQEQTTAQASFHRERLLQKQLTATAHMVTRLVLLQVMLKKYTTRIMLLSVWRLVRL